ncbi:MAG TPA: flavin reductase family protein [Anaerolineae bacterium]|nr:flavin reductase family protein [Anaerolineae bacterium]
MDEAAKKTVLRWFTYGLHVVAAAHDGELALMTANFITQSSFEPPHVALAVEVDSKTHRLIEASRAFAVNVLSADQRELAGQLGRKSVKAPSKTEGIAWRPGAATGAPIVESCLGWIECRVTGSLPSGDHTVYVAQVVEAGINREGAPLTLAEAGFRHSG